jgi:membrane peptidoglycan carboxypeptidase
MQKPARGKGRVAPPRLDRGVSAEDTLWRRTQRERRIRMTRRGRVTIATVLTGAAIAFLWLLEPHEAVRAFGIVQPMPDFDASPPPTEPAPANQVPEDVLAHLPVGREALTLPSATGPGASRERLYEHIDVSRTHPELAGPLRVEYTLDRELTERTHEVLRRGRVDLGTLVVLEPRSGRVLAYAATDTRRFPPTRTYPAASLVKVITAATALDHSPEVADQPCRFSGSPYRLTPSRVDPPRTGPTVTLERALATSNNQCFAQIAVHFLGVEPLMEAFGRFGWLAAPAPAHESGSADPGEDRYDLGRLGSGLAGTRITPLHAALLAASLAQGELVTPQWVERVVDANGRELPLPPPETRRVMSPELARRLREMLTETTRSGTARRAFHKRGGRPLLGEIEVAGKTGSLTGRDPDGHYEWFIGVAPADDPRIAVAAVIVNGKMWWRSASQVAADLLQEIFCSEGGCATANAVRIVSSAAQGGAAGGARAVNSASRRVDRSETSSSAPAEMSAVSRGSSTRS